MSKKALSSEDIIASPLTMRKQDFILHSLRKYYDSHPNIGPILDIINTSKPVSLRMFEWFVTDYAKENNISYQHKNRQFIVYLDYKNQLKAYTKKQFDPFQRRERIMFDLKDAEGKLTTIETTVGQLNYFRWAYNVGLVDYIISNREQLEELEKTTPKRVYTASSVAIDDADSVDGGTGTKKTTRKKRHTRSATASRSITCHDVKMVIDFS